MDSTLDNPLYYEAHITIAPVLDEEKLKDLRELVKPLGFRVADLLMRVPGRGRPSDLQRSELDTFLSSRSDSRDDIVARTALCCAVLRGAGFEVWRYKVEAAILDTKINPDKLKLVSARN